MSKGRIPFHDQKWDGMFRLDTTDALKRFQRDKGR